MLPKKMSTTDSTPSSMRSVTADAVTVAKTRCSRGNETFFTSPPLPRTVPMDVPTPIDM